MPSVDDVVQRVDRIQPHQFYRTFVRQRRPVVMRNLTAGWPALRWDLDRFRSPEFDVPLPVKSATVARGPRDAVSLSRYVDMVAMYEEVLRDGGAVERPGYLHDVPLFEVFPSLRRDVDPFPFQFLPKWYARSWSGYAQCFIGATGGTTPLHFDTLLTHNLFFHLVGRKRFVLIPPEQQSLCYLDGWRWARFDPTAPDYDKYPDAARTTPVAVELEPGDVLYLPPGTLHHVTNLTMSISFNIDWHTAGSALQGVASIGRGAPLANGYYNLLCFLGVGLGFPERAIFPLYRSYLYYES